MKLKWVFMVLLLVSLTGCIVAPAPPPPAVVYRSNPYGYYTTYPYSTYYYPGPAYIWPGPGVWWGYRGGYWHHR